MSISMNYNNLIHIAVRLRGLTLGGVAKWARVTFTSSSGHNLKLILLAPMPSTSGPASASLLRRVTHICLDIVAYTWPYHLEQFSWLSHLAVPYVSGGNPSHPIGGLQPFLKLQSLEMLVVVVIKADLVDAALEEW